MNKSICLFLLLSVFCSVVTGQSKSDSGTQSKADFDEFISQKKDTSTNLASVANLFLDLPYVSHTLEVNADEQLVINLKEMDCMTLVENCIALKRIITQDSVDFDHFCKELQYIRYRNGIIDGYQSRLHYTSDWIKNNEKKGVLTNRTKDLGGNILPVNVSFMSTHPGSYKQLILNPELIDSMRIVEQSINQGTYHFIPTEKINIKENLINDGDIICFTTAVKGLDISHLGIACRKNGIITFIHASSNAQKVIINPESIANYCSKIKNNTGIIVLTLLDP
jgi:hypothetical protein